MSHETSSDETRGLAWILTHGDADMRAHLRELATPPWPQDEPPRALLPRSLSPILLGLLRDEEAIDTLIALIPFAQDRELTYVVESCPLALAAIGRPIIQRVIGRMLEIECTGELYSPDVRVEDSTFEYWGIASALAFLASHDPDSHGNIAPFFRERVAGLEIPAEGMSAPSPAAVWIDLAQTARIPEIDELVRSFLEVLPKGYRSQDFGTAAECLADFAPDRPGIDLQATLETSYYDAIARSATHKMLNDEWSRLDRDGWYAHLLAGTGPFESDMFDSIDTTPELLAMLRQTVAPPWNFSDDPDDEIRNDLPIAAAFLLGLHGSHEDAGLMLQALRAAVDDDWERMTEVLPYALAALGPDAIYAIITRIEALEAVPDDSMSPAEMSVLIAAAGFLARAWPDAMEPFIAFALPRIADPGNDSRSASECFEMSIAEAWVSAAFYIVDSRLKSAILGFFDRAGEAGSGVEAGNRDDYLQRPTRMRRLDPRFSLEYRYYDFDTHLREPAPTLRQDSEEESDMRPLGSQAFVEYVRRLELGNATEPATALSRSGPNKIGRNDPCPCRSGKKYKKCCGRA